MFSGKDYVTANIYFPKICEIKMKMAQWSSCGNPVIEAMTSSMNKKFSKYWFDIKGLMGMATLLDPRYKNEMLLVCFAMLHGTSPSSPECEVYVGEIVTKLCTLLEEYHLENDDGDTAQPSLSFASMESPALMSLFNARVAQKKPASFRMKTELDRYLEDELVPCSENFNVLDWWKMAGTRYPTLQLVARDIFAIPVSTVASESAFSTSGRVLSDHRGHLTPEILEALMCSQDWIRNKYKDGENGHAASFWTCLQDIQEGMQDLAL